VQEVIDRCWQLGERNPILSIHDVGAGGLSNALPELAHGAHRGAKLDLRAVPSEDSGMSPREVWCNEAQERYVLAIHPSALESFRAICERERCPFSVLGTATEDGRLVVEDPKFRNKPVDLDLQMILGKPPKMLRDVRRLKKKNETFSLEKISIESAVHRVLRHPAVADKTFLIAIGDRTVGGLCARDPFVGPWQVPVADCAVTLRDYDGRAGEAFALGERTPLALIDAPASGRMAVGEAITNIAAAEISSLKEIKLSANWMAAAGYAGEDAALYDTVKAVALELCPALGIAIPVGKDSLSMQTSWQGKEVVAPLSLIVTGLRAGRRCRQKPYAAASRRRGRHRARAGGPRTREEPPRRLDPRAGLRRHRRSLPRPRRSRAAQGILRVRAEGARADPGLSRSVRRRPVRHRLRDGVRRALRCDAQSRRARLRGGQR
jgi:phosphoribosylformylglycinamidine synthase